MVFENGRWSINPFFPLVTRGWRGKLIVFQLDRFQKLLPLIIASELITLALGVLRIYDQATWPYTSMAALVFLFSTYCRLYLVPVEKINTADIQSIRPAPLLIWIEHFIYFLGIALACYGIYLSESGTMQTISLIMFTCTLALALFQIANFLFGVLYKRLLKL